MRRALEQLNDFEAHSLGELFTSGNDGVDEGLNELIKAGLVQVHDPAKSDWASNRTIRQPAVL